MKPLLRLERGGKTTLSGASETGCLLDLHQYKPLPHRVAPQFVLPRWAHIIFNLFELHFIFCFLFFLVVPAASSLLVFNC